MTMNPSSRRRFLSRCLTAAPVAALGLPVSPFATSLFAAGPNNDVSAHVHDWDWLVGNWDVKHSRLKERLVGDTHWEEFRGRSALWTVLGGQGNIDDNWLDLPGGAYYGMTLRAFDPAEGKWLIWWLDGRTPTSIDPPVRGAFDKNDGVFFGRDTFKGRPIIMRFHWRDIHSSRPWWEQAFSADEGKTWEINWRNWFTRTQAIPVPQPKRTDAPRDFDFLVGSWKVRHRRLRPGSPGAGTWDEFDGTLVNWPVLGGHGNVGDNMMNLPGNPIRGIGLRAFDPATKQWLVWWLNGRRPTELGPPIRGGFIDGVGTFIGDDEVDGRKIKTRAVWSNITPRSARWEQASSEDGKTWQVNWISEFERA